MSKPKPPTHSPTPSPTPGPFNLANPQVPAAAPAKS